MKKIIITLCIAIFSFANNLIAQNNITIHVVQRGETLFRIATRYELTVDELAELNGIININDIKVGQRLLVSAETTDITEPKTHVVQPGQNLRSIAELYDTSVEELIEIMKFPMRIEFLLGNC